jgi:methylglyoxal synthase
MAFHAGAGAAGIGKNLSGNFPRNAPAVALVSPAQADYPDPMEKSKRIALVAHDNRKKHLAEWVEYNYRTLLRHNLICTGTTGRIVEEAIRRKMSANGENIPFEITRLKSGPLGGDQQLGALITEQQVNVLIFLWDPMEPQPHDVDVKALLRLAVLYNVPTACNRSTADFIISSELFGKAYQPIQEDYTNYLTRPLA